MKKIFIITASSIALLVAGVAAAQQAEILDIEAIRDRAASVMAQAQEVVDGSSHRAEEFDEDAAALIEASGIQLDSLDPADFASDDGQVDFEAIVAGAQDLRADVEGTPLLMSFVSLSMPPEALSRVISETTSAGGLVVFRGFSSEGPQVFVRQLVEATGENGARNIVLDPRLFRAFSVDRVPTYVAASRRFDPCDGLDCVSVPPAHDRLTGNVPLSFALRQFSEGNGPGRAVSVMALQNMDSAR